MYVHDGLIVTLTLRTTHPYQGAALGSDESDESEKCRIVD